MREGHRSCPSSTARAECSCSRRGANEAQARCASFARQRVQLARRIVARAAWVKALNRRSDAVCWTRRGKGEKVRAGEGRRFRRDFMIDKPRGKPAPASQMGGRGRGLLAEFIAFGAPRAGRKSPRDGRYGDGIGHETWRFAVTRQGVERRKGWISRQMRRSAPRGNEKLRSRYQSSLISAMRLLSQTDIESADARFLWQKLAMVC